MDGGLSADAPLDYASFQTWPTENRYEAFVCYNDKEEKLASGVLEQLKLHLPQLKDLQYEEPGDHLELRLPESLKGSTWFNKYTLSRFLHIVGVPELLKNANAIRVEMSQLEEARKFHLALYTQGHQDENQSDERVSHDSKDTKLNTKPELQISSTDHTKNELLRAIDLRLAVLKEELIAAFRQVIDDTSSCKQIADLVAFCQHFGAEDLSNSLSKYLELSQEKQNIKVSQGLGNGNEKMKEEMVQPPVVKPIQYGASPAKAAQVERHSSTESEDSSNSGAEDPHITERSRSLVRSASPRRSASPMRRVQIGRSGSRRAPALTIKSLSYIPAKERVFSSKDAGNSSDEESVQPQKISVKDAINLFERKQRDQSSDLQNKKSSGDASLNTSKSVLRRWSAGMGDPSTQSLSADSCESYNDTKSRNTTDGEKIQKPRVEVKAESDLTSEDTSLVKTDENAALKEEEDTSFSTKNLTDDGFVQPAENNTKVTASADWTKQKQDELNLMMMKMMESKPNRTRTAGAGVSRSQELPRGGQRGGFYDHYKQKRDEKLRGDNSGKRTEKEEKFKTLEVILKQKKVEMSSKATSVAEKPRKSQKNLSPSLQPKKEPSKSSSPLQPKRDSSRPAVPKKASPKASPLPATRKSWPSAPSPKTSAITPNKTPNSVSSTGTAPARRKSHPVPSPVQPGPKVDKLQPKPKSTTRTQPGLKGQEGKKQQPIKKTTNVSDAKVQASEDGSGVAPAKPSFYNKVTKKGSVVPLESKPFLRKRSGAGPGVAPGKAKVPPSDEPSSGGNFTAVKEPIADISDQISPNEEEDPKLTSVASDVASLQQNSPVNSHPKCEEDVEIFVHESDNCSKESPDIQPESVISPTAWVEIEEHQEASDSLPTQTADTTTAEPITLSTSPRVRHSLSQMLQEDNGEPEIIEWGNAENPPAIVYQKDVSKGLKRLLKFARKSKGDANTTGWSSPSVFSDGEEDAEEPKATSKRHADAILRKAPFQAKGFGQPRTSSGANYDGGNSSNYATTYDLPPGQSNLSRLASHASEKLQEGHIPSAAAASSTKSRSFFSLSTFRSSKSNETKPR